MTYPGKLVKISLTQAKEHNWTTPNPRLGEDSFTSGRKGYRYARRPWYVTRPASMILAILFVAILAALLFALVKGITEKGFPPLVSTRPIWINGTSIKVTRAELLWNFIPVIIAAYVTRLWIMIDMFFRVIQPFVSLSRPTVPDKSILLNYPTMLPGHIIFQACTNGHWKLAWIASVSLLTRGLPVLVGGVFTSQDKHNTGEFRIYPQKTAFIFIIALFIIYSLTFIVIWLPGTSRKMPRNLYTIADTISILHQSQLLDDPEFAHLSNKEDLVAKLRLSRHLYAYGITAGRDGMSPNQLAVDQADRVDWLSLQESKSEQGCMAALRKRLRCANWDTHDTVLP